jgi:hypothetical protein
MGFAMLHDLIPSIVGACMQNQAYDFAGNASQPTVNGKLQWRKVDNWTAFTNGYLTWINTVEGVQSRLSTQRFSWEPNPANLPLADGGSTQAPAGYLDDRSNAHALMTSFVNALNRKEYVRAYSYWEPNAAQLPPFDAFQQGYANTASVHLTLGVVLAGAAAGNLYYAVPTTLVATNTDNSVETFVGCYLLHLGQPANQGVPPFQPLAIQSATVRQVPNGTNTAPLMSQACAAQGGSALPPLPPANPNDVSASRYLDDRSTAQQLMRSFVNAINRHEHLRAYSYWEPQAPQLPPYDQFQQGYANTQSVQLTIGIVGSDTGAGQVYYRVPVTLVAQTTGGGTQYFIGCYILHISQPGIQGVPPFQPLAIRSANVQLMTSQPDINQAGQFCQ